MKLKFKKYSQPKIQSTKNMRLINIWSLAKINFFNIFINYYMNKMVFKKKMNQIR